MAQPKNRHRRDEDKQKSANRAELENLQKKAEIIVQKRNDLNAQANAARAERDMLNAKQKEVAGQLNALKKERDEYNQRLREAKEKRAEFQAQAKELIAKKRGRLKKDAPTVKSPRMRAQELLSEINDLEFSQQTRVLSVAQENELLKQLRLKRHEYEQLRREVGKAEQLKIDLSDIDQAIDQLFAQAEEQHKIVLEMYKASQAAHERFVKVVNEIGTVRAEANKHHARFIELREKADAEHAAFLELREKMLELRGKDFADRQEARAVIREQRARVRDAVANPNKLAAVAEDRLDLLKKGGKITLGS